MNKDYAQPAGMKLGLSGSAKVKKQPPSARAPAMPMKTANWQPPPGKAQPSSRNSGVPKSGPLGQFEVKKVGL